MKKRFYLIIFTLMLTITLVACTPKNTYKLTLPEFVTSDVSDTNKVLDETLVTLTVSERDGFVLKELKANDVLLNVSNNKATFIMKEDTVISVSFSVLEEDVFYKLTLPDFVTSNLDDTDKVLRGTTVTLSVENRTGFILKELKVNNILLNVFNNKATFIMDSDKTVTVEYTKEEESAVYHKVVLNDYMTANISNLDKILKGTTIIIKVTPPTNKIVDKFYINGTLKELSNKNEISVLVDSDLTITLTLKDTVPVDEIDILLLLKNLNPRLLSDSRVNVFNTEIEHLDTNDKIINKIVIDLNKNIDERSFYLFNRDDTETWKEDREFYGKDGKLYFTSDDFETGYMEVRLTDGIIAILLDDIVDLEPFFIHPVAINDALESLFNEFKGSLVSGDILDKISAIKVDKNHHLTLELGIDDFDQVFDLTSEFFFGELTEEELEELKEEYKDIYISFKMMIDEDNNIKDFNVEFNLGEIEGTFNYSQNNQFDLEFIDIDKAVNVDDKEINLIRFLDGDDLILEFRFPPEHLDQLIEYNPLYKQGFIVEGFYLDKNFETAVDPEGDYSEIVDVYVKYKEIKDILDYRNELEKVVYGYYEVDGDIVYYENESYILHLNYNETFVLDKKTNMGYFNLYGGYYLIDGIEFVKDNVIDFKSFISEDFIFLANYYVNKNNPMNFIFPEGRIIYDETAYLLLTEEQLDQMEEFDFATFLENDFTDDNVIDVFFNYGEDLFHDIDSIDDFLDKKLVVIYESNNNKIMTAKDIIEMLDLEILYPTAEGEGYLTLKNDNYELALFVLAYKSTKGLALVNNGEIIYVNEIDSLEVFNNDIGVFYKLAGILFDGEHFETLDELKAYKGTKIGYYDVDKTPKSLTEITDLLSDKVLYNDKYGLYFDIENKVIYISNYGYQIEIHRNNDYYIIKDNNEIVEVLRTDSGIKFIEEYFKNRSELDFKMLIFIMDFYSGELMIDYDEDNEYYSNDDYTVRFNRDNEITVSDYMNVYYFNFSYDLPDKLDLVFAERSEISNDLNDLTIIYNYDEMLFLNLDIFNIIKGYKAKLFKDLEEVQFIENSYDYQLVYVKIKTPNEYLNEYSNMESLVIDMNNGYRYHILPGSYMEFYLHDRLLYIIEKTDDTYVTYAFDDDYKYLKPEGTYLLNVLEFIEVYKDLEFEYEYGYFYNEDYIIKYLDRVSFINNVFEIYYQGDRFDIDTNDITEESFVKADISSYLLKDEIIEYINIENMFDFDYILNNNVINIKFNWRESGEYSLLELEEMFDLTYEMKKEGLFIIIDDAGILKEYTFDIYDFNEFGPIVIIEIEDEKELVYLDELENYEIPEGVNGKSFIGYQYFWEMYYDLSELINSINYYAYEISFVKLIYAYSETQVTDYLKNFILYNNLSSTDYNFEFYNYLIGLNDKEFVIRDFNDPNNTKYIKELNDSYLIYLKDSYIEVNKNSVSLSIFNLFRSLNQLANIDFTIKYLGADEYYLYSNDILLYELQLPDISSNSLMFRSSLDHENYMVEKTEEDFIIPFPLIDEYQYSAKVLLDEIDVLEINYDINSFYLWEMFWFVDKLLLNEQRIELVDGRNILDGNYELRYLLKDNSEDFRIQLYVSRREVSISGLDQILWYDYDTIFVHENLRAINFPKYYLVDTYGNVLPYVGINNLPEANYSIKFTKEIRFGVVSISIIDYQENGNYFDVEYDFEKSHINEITNNNREEYFTKTYELRNVSFFIDYLVEYPYELFLVDEKFEGVIDPYNSLSVYYKNEFYEIIKNDDFETKTYNVKFILKGYRDNKDFWNIEIVELTEA